MYCWSSSWLELVEEQTTGSNYVKIQLQKPQKKGRFGSQLNIVENLT
jgi:hypothetical protein